MANPYSAVIESFESWSGTVPAGYTANFVGALARVDRLYPGEYIKALAERTAVDHQAQPKAPAPKSTDYFETGAVLDAVLHAKQDFRMFELGSGTGPWLALAARAAKARGIPNRLLVGVEGEPERFQWLLDNLAKNEVHPFESDTIRAVVAPTGKKNLKIYFPVGAPLFAGHTATISSGEISEGYRSREVSYVGRSEATVLEPAPVITLKELLNRHDKVFDLAHIDIQGLEHEVIADAKDEVQTRLRALAIGTHGAEIEADLRKTLSGMGWELVFSFPTQSEFTVDGVTISTKGLDGFQHWINPRLRN